MCVIIIVELIIRERLVENNLRSLSRGAIRSELIFPVAVIVLLHLLTLVLRELRAGVHQPMSGRSPHLEGGTYLRTALWRVSASTVAAESTSAQTLLRAKHHCPKSS